MIVITILVARRRKKGGAMIRQSLPLCYSTAKLATKAATAAISRMDLKEETNDEPKNNIFSMALHHCNAAISIAIRRRR